MRCRPVCSASGDIDEAIEAAEESVAQAERHGTTADLSSAYQQLAIAYHFKGAWPAGLHLEIEPLGAAPGGPTRVGTEPSWCPPRSTPLGVNSSSGNVVALPDRNVGKR